MTAPVTKDQAIHATHMLRQCGDHHSAAILESLAAQVDALTAERDAALSASRYETDLCGQALADLKTIIAERDALQAKLNQQQDMVEKCMVAMNRNADLGQAAEKERDSLKADASRANMFWDHADSERCYDSIDELLNYEWCNGSLEVGALFTVQRAVKMANINIRVTSIDDESGDTEFEVIDAAMAVQP